MNTSTWSAGDSRIAAIYRNQDKATKARESVRSKLKLSSSSVKILEPSKESESRKLESSSKAIGKNMFWLHFIYGGAGLAIGLMLGWVLVNYGPEFAQLNPTFTYIAMLSPGLFIGLFLSGLMSLKPHHDSVNQSAIAAANNNDWTLLIKLSEQNVAKEDVVPVLKSTGAKNII